jgi:hypothetical protein
MSEYRIQERPDMPGDGGEGDAVIFCSDWPADTYDRHKSSGEAWLWLGGELGPGDTVLVLEPVAGVVDDQTWGG